MFWKKKELTWEQKVKIVYSMLENDSKFLNEQAQRGCPDLDMKPKEAEYYKKSVETVMEFYNKCYK
jgi:hypothetical protein